MKQITCKFIWIEHSGVEVYEYWFGTVLNMSLGICGHPISKFVCPNNPDDDWASELIVGCWYEITFNETGDPVSAREVPDPFAEPVSMPIGEHPLFDTPLTKPEVIE